ncbi:MAG: DUF4982 domain-containing protein [Bacteroidales bacterium]|nr:DUF4982 domain-containing protein [Candidatus Liminaster caballi]
MKKTLFTLLIMLPCMLMAREVVSFNEGWRFSLGNASSPEKDFGCGTEYFNYLTKAAGIHNEGPYVMKFNDSAWIDVRLPHDWVTQLPFDPKASHSHGYRAVGYQYPENSVGWYRKTFNVAAEDLGKHFEVQFDGIFRNATVWCNGVYMGQEPSGYVSQVFDITDYLNYGGENLICVRADATLQEGWFYEGAGIYRNTWLRQTDMVHVVTDGTFVRCKFEDGNMQKATLTATAEIMNSSLTTKHADLHFTLLDADGNIVCTESVTLGRDINILPKATLSWEVSMDVDNPHLWDVDDPYLYTLRTEVITDGKVCDTYDTKTGFRDIKFTAEEGFFLNGRSLKLKGVNMHQDMAGVGAAIPDALQTYIVRRLKSMGANAYRASHNPMSPAMLEACDREGLLVIDENRLMGVNAEHLDLLGRMIRRDRNHPCVIMWSDGNEEWGLENNEMGRRMAESMREYTHRLDPTRPVTVANAGGAELIKGLEVVGYNYIIQNDVHNRHQQHPEWKIVGTEETTGCGTRGIYFADPQGRHMPSINRTETEYENKIERGWKFYHDTPWAAGLFYWTGFDYRGEPNPLGFPAVGSQFGLLDYCGFEKDEAWYLRAWWTDEPVLHIFPHWNLTGHEGETVSVWAYSNCDEVELQVNGKSLGRQQMPRDGHLKWDAEFKPGRLRAIGYNKGKKVAEQNIYTTGSASQIEAKADRTSLKADNQDVSVICVRLLDKKGRFVHDACQNINVTLSGNARILGVGNGDSAFKGNEHPATDDCQSFSIESFNGMAMVLIQTTHDAGQISVRLSADGLDDASLTLESK